MNLELLKAYALALVGVPYEYGGDDPMGGFDCSGLACEMLRASGVVPYSYRDNAQGLYNLVKGATSMATPELGALAFYGHSLTQITHVGFCLDSHTMIEAGGGDFTTTSEAIATKQNAFVRMRPVKYRRDFLVAVLPGYPT